LAGEKTWNNAFIPIPDIPNAHALVATLVAGEDLETAKYYPEDEGFLLELEPTVVHYEVVGSS
jgi:hypothetical protein